MRSVFLVLGYLFWVCFGVTSWAGAELISFGLPRERYLRRLFRLQQTWARGLFDMARRALSLNVHVEEGFVPDERPILLFVRHASLVDVLLPAVFISGPHDVLLRYVMKREVLFDPAIDLVGQRLENAFVSRGKGSVEREEQAIRALASGLGPREGVIVFPEGTRFSAAKRADALARIRESGDMVRLARAEKLEHVFRRAAPGRCGLGPVLAGFVSDTTGNPATPVYFIAVLAMLTVLTLGLFRGLQARGVPAAVRESAA